MVAAGGRHFECALGGLLSLDVPQVGQHFLLAGNGWLRSGQHLASLHVIDELNQVFGCQDIGILACPGCLGPGELGTDEPEIPAVGSYGGGQHAEDAKQRAIKRKFSHHDIAVEEVLWDDAKR
jgi:hypothetical protein